MSYKKLYATLIGINAYPQNPLNGCVRDALAVDGFLRNLCRQQPATEESSKLQYLPAYFMACGNDDQAILAEHAAGNPGFDAAVIKSPDFLQLSTAAFEHLRQAQDGDICLFYYSGHGSTTQAPEEFRGSKSRLQHETIVCVDSRNGARDLIDKEIAFLLWDALKGKNVHCLVIMDCCFSGNNTRAVVADALICSRHTADANLLIPLQQYLGFEQGFYRPKAGGGIDFPLGRYVHLAASLDNQTAQETAASGGLFTSLLLDVLYKGGSARSYRDLMETTRTTVQIRNPNQTPVEFAVNSEDLDQPFLGGQILPYRPAFELSFDVRAHKWKLFGGAMDGLQSTPDNPTWVKILDVDKSFSIEKVFSNFSYLSDSSQALGTDDSVVHQAVITKYATPMLQLCLSNGLLEDSEQLESLRAAYADGSGFPYISLFFEKEKQFLPYQIRLSDAGEFVLLRTGSSTPLFKREKNPTTFLKSADHIGKWLVTCDLKHTDTAFRKEDFVFRLERIEGVRLTLANLDDASAECVNPDGILPEETVFHYKNSRQPAFRLSVGIHPNARNLRSCYIGAIYLESKYGIVTDLIRADANLLSREGEPVALKFYADSKPYLTIPLSIDPNYQHYGINEITSHLKIIVARQPLNLDKYRQNSLELDDQARSRTRAGGVKRGEFLLEDSEDEAPDRNDWCVFSTRFRIVGPHKSAVLEGGRTADFSAFELEAPSGFDAIAFAGTGDDVAKKIADIRRTKSAQSSSALSPPAGLFGHAHTLQQPFSAGIGGAGSNGIQLLELRPSEPGRTVVLPLGEEIRIKPKVAIEPLETIVPFGYDEATGLYFPVGYTDGAGVVHIEQLPPPTHGMIEELSDGPEKEKSLGGSIKLFFQKVAWSPLTGIREYDQLSLHRRTTNSNTTKITYCGTERTREQAQQIAEALGKGEALLLIHGIIGNTEGMVEAIFESETLQQPFTGILSFDYENLNSGIEDTAQKLKDMLQACGFGEERRLTIVAHSMGGLVSRYLIEHLEGDRFVKKLIQCGTPNSGSEMADFRRKLTGWLFAGLNGVSIFQPYMAAAAFLGKRLEKGLFRTLDQMDPDSPFLAQLNAAGKPRPGIPYYLVGGNTGDIKAQYPDDASLLERIFGVFKKRGIYTGLDLAVFDSDPNDMAVKVERMRQLPWGEHDDAQILGCDHMSYFVNEQSLEKLGKILP